MEERFAKILYALSTSDKQVINRITEYIVREDMHPVEKLRLARLIALIDLEYDEISANAGGLPAREVLRVSSSVLAGLSQS